MSKISKNWFWALILVWGLFWTFCTKPGPQKEEKAEPGVCSQELNFPGAVEKVLPEKNQEPAFGDWLVRRLSAEPATLNPITATDVYSEMVFSLVMETLLEMDLATQELVPLLAERYEISPDKLVFTFYLRKNVFWQDGKPFNADDVIYSFERIMDPKVDSAHLRVYYLDCVEAKKLDDYTVRFRWRVPYFKSLEMLGGLPIVPKHILDDGTDFNAHPFGRALIGTGPYQMVSWETGKRIELVRNKDYWGKPGYFERIIFKIITDDNVSLQVFNQGGIDLVGLTPIQWLKQTNYSGFLKRANKIAYDYPQFGYIGWNLRRPPFDDKKVRKAMTMLLNRDAILKNIYFCLGKVVSGPVYINTPYYDHSIQPLAYDPAQAKQLLTEAGWIDQNQDGIREKQGKDFRFELLIPAGNENAEKLATIFKEDLKKAGIEMSIRMLEWSVFLKNLNEWKFDACMLGWAMDANTDLYQIWHSSLADIKASSNHIGYKNPEVDRLIEQARKEFDKEKRVQMYHQIHRIIAEDQPYTFLFTNKALIAIDKRIKNVIPYPIRPSFKFTDWFVPIELQKYSETDSSKTSPQK